MAVFKKIKHVFLICMISCGFGCTKSFDRATLKKMLKSDDTIQIIEAINYIAETNDTVIVKDMLENSFDPRITHDIRYIGMSIYQKKMGAMDKITGITAPNKITYKPDSVNIEFYLDIARKRGWMK